VGSRVGGAAHLFKGHRQVEVRVGVGGVASEGVAVARFRVDVTTVVVVNVAEIEM
jgi:hypothetical protein